jgi:hypothetical protein
VAGAEREYQQRRAGLSRVGHGGGGALALRGREPVQAAHVEQQGVPAAELGSARAGDVGPQEPHLRTGHTGAAPGAVQRQVDGIHACHLPAVQCSVDGIAASAAADVEHLARRQGIGALDQLGHRHERLVLPGGVAHPVQDPEDSGHGILSVLVPGNSRRPAPRI